MPLFAVLAALVATPQAPKPASPAAAGDVAALLAALPRATVTVRSLSRLRTSNAVPTTRTTRPAAATVNGRPYRELSHPLREVGALLDAKALHPGRSARNHLLSLAIANDVPRSRVDEVLDVVGLTDVANQRAGRFSLGMSQRLGIAGAILGDPGVLMFDEPINGLDPEGIRWIREFFQNLADEGRTVLVSSHLMSEMSLTADHFIVIGRGKLLSEGSRDELAQISSQFVHVRTPLRNEFIQLSKEQGWEIREEGETFVIDNVASATVGAATFEANIPLFELSPHGASLEDLFMQLTADSVEYVGKRRGIRGAKKS